MGLSWGQLSRSTCWVAPDCSCPSARGSKQVRWGAGRECTAGESDVSYKACRQPSEKPVLTLRENQIQMCSGIPTFLQPIAGLLEGLEPSSTVVNLRHLAVYKPSICVYHLFAIWEFGLTRATLEMSLISLFIHLSIVFSLIYLVHFFYWICRNKKNAFFQALFHHTSSCMEKWNLIQAFSGTQRHPHSFQRQNTASSITFWG